MLALVDAGDEVVVTSPGYPPSSVWARIVGAKVRTLSLHGPRWDVEAGALEKVLTPRTKLLVLCSPQRPTGHIIRNFADIVAVCRQYPRLTILSDEIFSGMTYDAPFESISSLEEICPRTVVIDSFSKTYAMTGWRIGYVVAPVDISERLSYLVQESITNVPTFVQQAALAALIGPQQWVAERISLLKFKRDRMVQGLQRLGFEVEFPAATFYAFANTKAAGVSSGILTKRLLAEAQVAVVDGAVFGVSSDGYLRLTFAIPDWEIDEGVRRIADVIDPA